MTFYFYKWFPALTFMQDQQDVKQSGLRRGQPGHPVTNTYCTRNVLVRDREQFGPAARCYSSVQHSFAGRVDVC